MLAEPPLPPHHGQAHRGTGRRMREVARIHGASVATGLILPCDVSACSNQCYNGIEAAKMLKLKLTTIGSSVGVILPKEALARLRVDKGDSIFLTEDQDGFRITPFDPEFEKTMASARKVMRRRRNALRELAK
jgi:putative addiction module antidote